MKKQKSENERQAYNGLPLRKGEVLVPMVADENFKMSYHVSEDKLREWHVLGITYQVAFRAVPEEYVNLAMRDYRAQVNRMLDEQLGRNRGSRCMVPQLDGSFKSCPKKRGDNHPACKDCPYKGVYEKEDRATVSYDALGEEYELCPEAPDDTEKAVLYPIMLDELLDELKEKDIRSYTVLRLCLDGKERKDVIPEIQRRFNLRKTAAYDIFNGVVSMVEEYFR